MVRSTISKLTATCLVSSTVCASVSLTARQRGTHISDLFERAELSERAALTCPIQGFAACNKNNLPGNFCCPTSTECVAFNEGKSAICCPIGKDCSTIKTISCDLTQQNATAHPTSELFTTDLTTNMETCGSSCCPQGYSCNNGQCTVSTGSASASASSSSPTSSPKPTSSTSKSASPTSNPSQSTTSPSSSASHPASSQNADAQAHCSQFPAAGVLVGFFSGLAVGAILAALVMCCFSRQRKEQPPSPGLSSVSAKVSDPIYQPQDANAFRSDFLRRDSQYESPGHKSRVRSLFSRTPTLRSMRGRDAPVDGIGRSIPPRTPENQRSPGSTLRREPSMESIKIYSPPNGGLGRPNTTFTDMMADAGFKAGEPYLGSPGRGRAFRDV